MPPATLLLLIAVSLGCAARLPDDGAEVAAGTDRQFEHTVETDASPQAVWAVWTDVAGWPSWDVELDSAALDGPFAEGAEGRLVPKRGPWTRFRIEAVEPGRAYTLVTRLPLGSLRVRRTWEPAGDGRIAVTFGGLGGRLLSGRLGPGFRRVLPVALARLVALAQAHDEAAGRRRQP